MGQSEQIGEQLFAETIYAPTTQEKSVPGSMLESIIALNAKPIASRSASKDAPPPNNLLDEFLATSSLVTQLRFWFGDELLQRHSGDDRDWLVEQLDRDVAKIDSLVESQLNAALHARPFQQLEATWRGIEYLVNKRQEYSGAPIVIKLLNVSWRELRNDAEAAIEFDQSQLFKKVYEEGLGTPGADPFSALLVDFSIHPRPSRAHQFDDMFLLGRLSQVAAAAFCPLITNADPSMFAVDRFGDLRHVVNLESLHAGLDFFAWQRFRDSEDSRFVSLALPKLLMRAPYRETYDFGFPFKETVKSRDDYLWGGAAFGMGEVLIRAFAEGRWFANIRGAQRGVEAGGIVIGPASDAFKTEPHQNASKSVTDCTLSDDFERELTGAGFLPLCACKDMPLAAFYSCASAQKPRTYTTADATLNARLSSQLNYMLCVSRFAHYLKIISRDKIGSCGSPEELQDALQRWIIDYVSPDPTASVSTRLTRPLLDAEVKIRTIPGTAGEYGCVIHLVPHYELDDMRVSIRLDTRLVQPVRR